MQYGIDRVTLPTPEPVSRETRHWVCFPCRKMFQKHSTTLSADCPQCAHPMIDMGRNFAPPPMSHTKLWDRLAKLAERGYRFHSAFMRSMIFGRMRDSRTPSLSNAIVRIDVLLQRGPYGLLNLLMPESKLPPNRQRRRLATQY